MQFHPHRAGVDDILKTLRFRGVALAGEGEVERKLVARAQHERHVIGRRRTRRGARARRGTRAAAEQGGEPRRDRLRRDLRTDEMNVGVEPARGDDGALAGDGFRVHPDDHPGSHVLHHVRVSGFADADNHPVLDPDVRLVDARVIHDERVGDDGIERARRVHASLLTHTLAKRLPAAELTLVAVGREVPLDDERQVRVAETNPIPHRRAVHRRVLGARDGEWRRGDRRTHGGHVKEPSGGDGGHRLLDGARGVRRPVHEIISAVHFASTRDGHDGHGLGLARFEAHGRARRDVQTSPEGESTIEREEGVALDHVIVRAHLDGAIARVGHLQHHAVATLVEDQIAVERANSTRRAERESVGYVSVARAVVRLAFLTARLPDPGGADGRERVRGGRREETPVRRERDVAVVRRDRIVHGDEFGAVREGSLHLYLDEDVGHGGEHVASTEHPPAAIHEVRHAEIFAVCAVAYEFEEDGCDERGGLGEVETNAAREAFLRERARGVKRELVHLSGRETHRRRRTRPGRGLGLGAGRDVDFSTRAGRTRRVPRERSWRTRGRATRRGRGRLRSAAA